MSDTPVRRGSSQSGSSSSGSGVGRGRGRRPVPGRVTIHDVAESLGVSLSTVSLALNGKGTISRETRARVIAEAARLGYAANPLARGLRAGNTGVLGLSVRSLDSAGIYRPPGVDHFSRMAGSAAFTALDRGFGLMLVPHWDRESTSAEPMWVDGYIIEDPRANDPVVARLVQNGVPVVTIGWDPAQKSSTGWVSTSDRSATLQVLDLLSAGRAKRICFVSGTEKNSWNSECERAYRSWCKRNGRPVHLERLSEAEGEAGGARLAAALLEGAERPDAIFCQTGRHAAGVATTALHLGLRIPQDLLVAAGSDSEQTRRADPPITAVDLQPESLGREAVELLIDVINGETSRATRTIEAKVIVRPSTSGLSRRR